MPDSTGRISGKAVVAALIVFCVAVVSGRTLLKRHADRWTPPVPATSPATTPTTLPN